LVSFRNHNAEALNLKVLHLLIELGKLQKNRFGNLVLVIGIYLGFVIWSLGFKIDLFWYYCLLDNRGRAIHK